MDEDGMMTRRRLLGAGGLGTFGITIGALSVYNPTTLRYIGLDNRTDSQQVVNVRVDANGDRAFEREISVETKEHTYLPCEWPIPARSYHVSARLAGESEWTERPIRHDGNAYRRISIQDNGIEIYTLWPGDDYFEAREDITLCEIPWWVGEFRDGSQ